MLGLTANDLGLRDANVIHRNLEYIPLITHAINYEGAKLSHTGALMIDTGIYTGRSPKDKYFVHQFPSQEYIAWGNVNKPISQHVWDDLFSTVKQQLEGKELFVNDVYTGASNSSRRSIRFITEIAWQSQFVKNMFIEPDFDGLESFIPDFTFYNACKTSNVNWRKHGMNSDVFIVFNIEEKIALIGGTWYSGELKKGVFTMMNYWLPLENKLSMHCSANVGTKGDTALFFGLSGTGKTTLSTDANRALVGDDEHGWDKRGIFNFEGGCYAKVINLDPKSEPEIYEAIKPNAILENVVYDSYGIVNFKDSTKTENTRVSYPLHHIKNSKSDSRGYHPQNIIFLAADAFGVLPPISKLTKEQAIYYFLSGYTAKVAGTERGITEPKAAFSPCFGEAFLPLYPTVYAELLEQKIDKHCVNIYLVNTGWIGGSYGIGKRMSIKNTRACINAILDGKINQCEFKQLPFFNLSIPIALEGVDTDVLNPRNTWEDKVAYDTTAKKLVTMFVENYKKFKKKNIYAEYLTTIAYL